MQVTKKILKAFRSDKLDRVYFCSHSEDKGSITIFNNDGSIFGMEGVEASLEAYGESKQRKFDNASATVYNYTFKNFNVMGTVAALNTEKYEAVPIMDYLKELNKCFKMF